MWLVKHKSVNGVQLVFIGRSIGLFGMWIKWWFLIFATLGIYGVFWVIPYLDRSIVVHTEVDNRIAIQRTFQIGSVTCHA